MVQFNKHESGFDSYTITNDGTREDYIDTIKSLLNMMGCVTEYGFLNHNDIYNMCSLISNMLPDHNQVISKEDAEILQSIKQVQKKKEL